MQPFTFKVDVTDEIHDCAWIQIADQLVYLPVGLLLHIFIDGICTVCGVGEVNIEPICKVGLPQGLQELRLRLEFVVYEYSSPRADEATSERPDLHFPASVGCCCNRDR